ncbi:unnamed protein product [Rotaria sp. Silwood2]|nr:unnamed protein product [Rotaria sp. Silwood2]
MFYINELGKQLEEIEATRDLIQQTIIQRTENRKQHTLLKKIDQLEQESIVKIRQVTEEVRNKLFKYATQLPHDVKKNLHLISNDMKKGREENDFSEIDIQQWTQKLEKLKK